MVGGAHPTCLPRTDGLCACQPRFGGGLTELGLNGIGFLPYISEGECERKGSYYESNRR